MVTKVSMPTVVPMLSYEDGVAALEWLTLRALCECAECKEAARREQVGPP